MKRKLTAYTLLICFLTFLNAGNVSHGETLVSQEYAIKTAFIFHFFKFVDWPEKSSQKSDKFTVCILGDEHLFPYFEELNGRKVKGKKVEVKQTKFGDEIENCNILFVGKTEQEKIPEIMARIKGRSILSVGDAEGFSRQGGMINFVMKEDMVRFEINPDSVQEAGLKMSSKMLSLGIIVHSDK